MAVFGILGARSSKEEPLYYDASSPGRVGTEKAGLTKTPDAYGGFISDVKSIKTMHVTPASISLEVLLKSRFKIMTSKHFEVVGYSTTDASGAKFKNSGFGFVGSKYLTRRFDIAEDMRFFWESFKTFKKEKPVIVNTYGPKPGLYARVAARLAGVPVIVHTSWGLFFEEGSPWYKKYPVILLEKIASYCCDYIFSVNEDDLELMKKYKFKKARRLGYLGNGTDVKNKFEPARYSSAATIRSARLELGLSPDTIVIGMVGRLTESKGYREFFAAAKIIRSKYSNVEFVVIGPYDTTKGDGITKDNIKQLEEQQIIKYLGSKTHDEMPKAYAIMDIVVLMSHREGFPRSLVEASAMAKPIIATNIRGCREAVEDRVNGYLVPIKDIMALVKALEVLISDSRLRERMGEASRSKALEEFDEDKLVNKVMDIYGKLLGGKAASQIIYPCG